MVADAPIDPSGWEDLPRRRPASEVPVLSVDGFEGPLDWLLEMVRAHKIDLGRLSILALIESFADALAIGLAQRDPGTAAPLWRWGDWLVMAANLALLRSRLMLPVDSGEAGAARSEAEALRQRLVDRVLLEGRTDWLGDRPQLGQVVFARGQPERQTVRQEGDLTDLLRACLAALQLPDGVALYQPAPPRLWLVADAIARIRAMLGSVSTVGQPLGDFLPELAPDRPAPGLRRRAALASTLVAGLELARAGALTLTQETAFGPVLLCAAADSSAEPDRGLSA